MNRKVPLYWHFNFARGPAKVAMRIGGWKVTATLSGTPLPPAGDIFDDHQAAIKNAELAELQLYHLRRDPGEQHDLAQAEPERLQEMKEQLTRMYLSVRDESPSWPEWKWPRHEGKIIRAYYDQQESRNR